MPLNTPSRRAVQEEQLRMIWAHARIGVLVATAFAVVMGLGLREALGSETMVDAWLVIKVVVSTFRWLQGRPPLAPSPRITLAGLIVDGMVWGAAGLYVAIAAPWTHASFVIAALACISCVATFGLQFSVSYTAGYVIPILAPTALGMLARGEMLGQLGSLGLLMLIALQIITAARSEQRLTESIRLRMQAQALAQEKDEALKTAMRQSAVKTQFLANMSHELRTPLHGILGMSRILHLDIHEPRLRQRVELIQSSGTHLLGLINDLLDISRVEAGQFVLRNEPYDLQDQLRQLTGLYTMRAEEKGLRFDVRNRLPSPCWVMGDAARFRQVLHNLLGNAIKFTQHGGVTLTITHDADEGGVCAEVTDTGPGIAAADLDRIFDAFQQTESGSTKKANEGVGLGLTIARDIARAMGGDISATSEPGYGTTMLYTAFQPAVASPAERTRAEQALPHMANPLSANAAGHGAPPMPRHMPPQTGTQTAGQSPVAEQRPCLVLLAEDNEVNALVATNFLELIGAVTEHVKDGREAVQHALREVNRPDLILMDCHMPVMDGYEATREIRQQEKQLGLMPVPIVALTATAGDAEKQDCLEAGMDDFLSKPCTLEELSRVVSRWSPSQVMPPALPQDELPGDAPVREASQGATAQA